MPKKHQHIEAKPTIYKGVQYKSRLEARWAVFLDHHYAVHGFSYEPFTVKLRRNGWTYTPDFLVTYHKTMSIVESRACLLEVKPTDISAEYGSVLNEFADNLRDEFDLRLFILTGDFFNLRFRATNIVEKTHPVLNLLFPRPANALQIASQYRFDLRSGSN